MATLQIARNVELLDVDGEPVLGRGRLFELLPGTHTLRLESEQALPNTLFHVRNECSATLELAAGRRYTSRADLLREWIEDAKAPHGSVSRYRLEIELREEGSVLPPGAITCSEDEACRVLWRRSGNSHSLVSCSRYAETDFAFGAETPRRSFRNADPDELAGGHGEDCAELDGQRSLACHLHRSAEALIVDLEDGTSLLFVPASPTTPAESLSSSSKLREAVRKRDAARQACSESETLALLLPCLREQGYVLRRPEADS